MKSFIEARRHSIDEGTWFALAAAFNSCRSKPCPGRATGEGNDERMVGVGAGGWWRAVRRDPCYLLRKGDTGKLILVVLMNKSRNG